MFVPKEAIYAILAYVARSQPARDIGWYVVTSVRTDNWPYSKVDTLYGHCETREELTHAIAEDKIRYWDGMKWRVN